jgi:hypothetical protein
MVWGDRTRTTTTLALAALLLTGATGCATATTSGPTLADTKSPVQLLRNEAASRIPPAVIETVSDTEDFSIRCKSESEDPIGLRRSWHSNAQVTVEAGAVWRVDQIVDEIGQSFADQGWTVAPVAVDDHTHAVEMTRDGSASEIRVSSHRPNPEAPLASDEGKPVTIDVELHGPCVDTEGPDSDAVRKLEAQD